MMSQSKHLSLYPTERTLLSERRLPDYEIDQGVIILSAAPPKEIAPKRRIHAFKDYKD